MRRRLALFLVYLELPLALLFLAGSLAFWALAPRAFPSQGLARLQKTLEGNAQALEGQERRLTQAGLRLLPAYAMHLHELSVVAGRGEALLASFRQNPALPLLGLLGGPASGAITELDRVAEELEGLLPRASRTLLATSRSLAEYGEVEVPRTASALAETAQSLRKAAAQAECLRQQGPRLLQWAGAGASLLALLLLCFALNQALNLPPPRKPSP